MTDYATPFIVALGGRITPAMKAAVSAWQLAESGSRVVGNNPWNLHIGPPCSPTAGQGVRGFRPSQPLRSTTIAGLIGNRYAGPGDRNVAIFDTADHGSAAAARNLMRPDGRLYGYDKVAAAARAGDPVAFLNALAASSWSAGRYGTRNGGPNKLLAIYRQLAPEPRPTPKPEPKPIPKPEVVMSDPNATAAITNAGYIDRIATAEGFGDRIAPYTAKIVTQVGALDARLASPADTADPAPAEVPTTYQGVIAELVRLGFVKQEPGKANIIDSAIVPKLPADLNRAASAFGIFGNPLDPVAGADYSGFTGPVTKQTTAGTEIHHFVNGVEV